MHKLNKKKYLMIEVSKHKVEIVNNILAVFAKRGYFNTDDIEMTEKIEMNEYWFDIYGVGFDTAMFVGDMMDAALGDSVGWFHYNGDPESDDD